MPKNVPPILVCLVVSLAPLPFGSAEPFWGAVWCALLGVALLLGAGRLGSEVRLRTPILLLLSVVAVWCVIVALQYLPAGLLTPPDRVGSRLVASWATIHLFRNSQPTEKFRLLPLCRPSAW